MIKYSYRGQEPQAYPTRIRLSDGTTRTGYFTPEELFDAGYSGVEDPTYNAATQVVTWDKNSIAWVVRDKTEEEISNEKILAQQFLKSKINSIRNQRILSGFEFNGNRYDSQPEDQKRISAASLLAFMAIMQGAQANNYLWHGGTEPFSWITQDNQTVEMDAQTVVMFGKTAAEWERKHIFAARKLKDMTPIPDDFYEDYHWE